MVKGMGMGVVVVSNIMARFTLHPKIPLKRFYSQINIFMKICPNYDYLGSYMIKYDFWRKSHVKIIKNEFKMEN